jgi:hypothetical protein
MRNSAVIKENCEQNMQWLLLETEHTLTVVPMVKHNAVVVGVASNLPIVHPVLPLLLLHRGPPNYLLQMWTARPHTAPRCPNSVLPPTIVVPRGDYS